MGSKHHRGISRRTLLTHRPASRRAIGVLGAPYVARAQALKPVKLTIQFFARGDYAHVYLARERGYYKEQGLDVTFQHVLGNALALQALTAGNADLIHADLVQMLQLQGKTPEPRMRAVGLISDKLALSLFFQKGKGIDKPKDLEGRSIVDSPGSTAPFIFNLFAKANGIDTNKVTVEERGRHRKGRDDAAEPGRTRSRSICPPSPASSPSCRRARRSAISPSAIPSASMATG